MPNSPLSQAAAARAARSADAGAPTVHLSTGLTLVLAAAILYVARDVVLPIALAVLVTFALSLPVNRLRKRGVPRGIAVGLVGVGTAVVLAGFLAVLGAQVTSLAEDLPRYQSNITQKIEGLKTSSSESGLVKRLTRMFTKVSSELAVPADTATTAPSAAPSAVPAAPVEANGEAPAAQTAPTPDHPLPVTVVDPQGPVKTAMAWLQSLVAPLASLGLVIVVVIFMLLESDQVRDRFIRLIGASDLHRTTVLLQDAAGRVGQYLLTQLLINVLYGVPLGVLLWLIGVPSAPLWGLLAIVLRFIPYIGPVLAAAFPLFLAFAVAPGWSMLLWTAGLFITLELISNNIVEPWLYGSRTGVTPLAIIVSAIFWAWIWGPMGLVLSTPLTVCLVVIGRYVPQFEFFSILFGDEPVLAPEAQLYQRLLSGDTAEATTRATEATAEDYLADFHQDVTIPALALAERDRRRGVLTAEQEARFAEATTALLDQLDLVIEAELESAQSGDGAAADATATDGPATGSGAEAAPADLAPADRAPALELGGRKLVLVGGRSGLDDLLARTLLQAVEAEGAAATQISRRTLLGAEQAAVAGLGAECAVLVFLSGQASRASLLQARRLKRWMPGARVGLFLWQDPGDPPAEPLDTSAGGGSGGALDIAALGLDFAAGTVDELFAAVSSTEPPRPLPSLAKPARPGARKGAGRKT